MRVISGKVVSAVSAALFGSVGLISLAYRVYKKIKFELSLGARYSDRMMGVPSPITVPPKEPEEAPSPPVGASSYSVEWALQ
jgi:hypothetical protein